MKKVAKKGRHPATLAERIRTLLTDQGKTVTWLANSIGVTRAAASRIVNGQTADPAASIVKRIADALEVSADDLLRS